MKFVRIHHVFSLLATGGIVLVLTSSGSASPFPSLDQFVLFAEEELALEQGVQVSSGDLGTNGKLDIQKEATVSGDLFADELAIDKNSQVNGSASYNNLKLRKEAQILGTQTKPISLPVAILPEIPDFQVGTEDFKFKGEINTLPAGNYRDLTLEKESRLALGGGTYDLNKLELKENSTLIFNSPTILNIKKELRGQERVIILPGNKNLKPTDLMINHRGEGENKAKPVEFGKESFLNFKLLAPGAAVHIGESSSIRGQILARKVKVEKETVASREVAALKEFDPTKVIIDNEKSIYPTNEVIVNFISDATAVDAQLVAELVSGIIVGHISFANAYQIQVSAVTEEELGAIINQIKSSGNSKIEGAFPNFIQSVETL